MKMARCKAKAKSAGLQCGKYSRKGYTVCAVHGAGYRRKPGGRPLIHGKYSAKNKDLARVFWLGARERLMGCLQWVIFRKVPDLAAVLDRAIEAREAGLEDEEIEQHLRFCVEMSRLSFNLAAMCLAWMDVDVYAQFALRRKRTKKEQRLAEIVKQKQAVRIQ